MVETGLRLASIEPARVTVKVPVTAAGTAAAAELVQRGVRVCLTACYGREQALVAASVGAEYLTLTLTLTLALTLALTLTLALIPTRWVRSISRRTSAGWTTPARTAWRSAAPCRRPPATACHRLRACMQTRHAHTVRARHVHGVYTACALHAHGMYTA